MAVATRIPPSVRNALVNAAGLLPRPAMGRLCVLTSGRTGSELLVELLDSHPQMRCEGEILRDPQRNALRFVRGRVHSASRGGAKAYGFKFVGSQARSLGWKRDLPEFVRALSDDGFVHVRLRRRNVLRQAVSQMRAAAVKEYHARTEPTRGPMHLDPVHLIYTMRNVEILDAYLEQCLEGRPAIELVYEDDLERAEQQASTLAGLYSAVGIEPVAPTSSLRKQTPSSLGDAIENLDEIATALRTTRYAEHLDD